MPDLYTHAFSDNARLAKGKTMIAPADGTWNLISLPRFAFVKEVFLLILEAYVGAGSAVTIGFMGNGEVADPDAFMTNTETAPLVAGMKRTYHSTAVCCDGKYFGDASGAITLTTTEDTSIGNLIVFADYTVVH